MRQSANKQYSYRSFASLLFLSGLSASAILLSGCSGPDPNAAAAAASASATPIEIEQTLARLEPTLLVDLGRINLFDPLIPLEDPSLNQTPVADAPPTDTSPTEGPAMAATLDSVTVNGIIYSPNNRRSMAILKLEGSEATQILQVGQSFVLPNDTDTRIQLNSVTKKSVVLSAIDRVGHVLETKGYQIEDIVGFKSSEKKDAKTPSGASDSGKTPPPSPTVGAPDSMAANTPATTGATN